MAGIYIHIPFCKQACHYCDFHFSTNQQLHTDLIKALQKEMNLQSDYLEGDRIKTIYFGGGTPSLCSAAEIDGLLNSAHNLFSVDSTLEITLEANPDDLTRKKLKEFKQAGINRLSIGLQSFDDSILRFLNRSHTSDQGIRSVLEARALGFDNVSVDLIYAIPGQDLSMWRDNIRQAIELSPEHLSCYNLTIEEKTAFGKWHHDGKLIPSSEETSAVEFELLMDLLGQAGYAHYEISNFCKTGFQSNHNSSYWRQERYLGLGPSAHSFNKLSRQHNIAHNAKYIQSISSGVVPFEKEILSVANQVNEYLLTGLRTSWGCSLDVLQDMWGYTLPEAKKSLLSTLLDEQMITIDDRWLKLTRKGKLLADRIVSDLFMEEV